jgi:RNA polymerase sigma-54 factor
MALSQTLVQKQTQKLIMTQDLRQSIELLPLSTMELAEKIQSELIENPLLEEVNNPEKPKVEILSIAENKRDEINDFIKNSDVSWQDTYSIDGPSRYDNEASNRNQKLIESKSQAKNLTEHLLEQLRLFSIKKSDYRIGEILISMLDEKGFLRFTVEELALELKVSNEKILEVLSIIHQLDPIGIGARDIQHTLLIQAQILYPGDEKLEQLIVENIKDLERLDYKRISRIMSISEDDVELLAKKIKALQPFPASPFISYRTDYIIPDVVVMETEGEFSIIVNDEWIPKLSINKDYKKYLMQLKTTTDKDYFDSKINSAKWLIRSINQRRQTLVRVMNSIVEFQIDFFRKGINFIKPLTLKDIAEKLNMHESTISRITTNKYVQTSWGILELKWFFSSGLKSHAGEMESSKKIHEMIKNLIKNEEQENPFSDQDIVEYMKKEGIEIARRTVAKYRKVLKILPANHRKKLKDLRTK